LWPREKLALLFSVNKGLFSNIVEDVDEWRKPNRRL
jgi:hypothetical protein